MRHPIQALLISGVFSAWVGGCVMLTFVPIENVAKSLHMKWTLDLLNKLDEFMLIIGIIVFLIAFIASLYDSFKKNKDVTRINEDDSRLSAITMAAFMFSLMIGLLLLGVVFVGWVLSFVIPEPFALLLGLIILSTWISATLLRAKRSA